MRLQHSWLAIAQRRIDAVAEFPAIGHYARIFPASDMQ
jgi:hypothetical protein